jgi:hypothetical protein
MKYWVGSLSTGGQLNSLTSSSDTTRNRFVYINVALNILRNTICLINTTTNPRPKFSSLQNARQPFPYTVPLVDICTRSWKTIEFMLVSASEPATCFALYSRTLRMRRGPNTNICKYDKTSRALSNVLAPIEVEVYRNDEPWVWADVSDRSAHQEHWRETSKLQARDAGKASTCGIWAGKDNHVLNYKLTSQNKAREILLALWNSPQ